MLQQSEKGQGPLTVLPAYLGIRFEVIANRWPVRISIDGAPEI